MTPPKKPWAWCKQPGCDTKLIFACRAGTENVVPYEYDDRAPFSDESAGCHVLVAGEAWVPGDAIEDTAVRFGISTEKARELVSGYPFHRAHFHDPDEAPAPPSQSDDAAAVAEAIAHAVGSSRFRYTDEVGLQDGLAKAFFGAGLDVRREVRLTDADRIDFLIRRVGVEVKVAGSVETVTRQLARYAQSERVTELVLVTTKHQHREVPSTIGGKPVQVVVVRGNAW